jgi:hypothetical protein
MVLFYMINDYFSQYNKKIKNTKRSQIDLNISCVVNAKKNIFNVKSIRFLRSKAFFYL